MINLTVNEENCKGCGLCVSVCPKKIMVLLKEKINAKGFHPAGVADLNACTGCASCALMCPDVVIAIERN